jgi:hypothetical protein
MTDRAFRKTISGVTNIRELYPTESAVDVNAEFVLPALVNIYEVTVPQSTFGAQAGAFVLGLFKTEAHY